MNSDLQKLIDLQVIDAQIAALKAEVAALPKQVAQIEAKLAGSKAQLDAAQAAMKADEVARRKHESDIKDQQEKISKYRDQSLKVKTNDEYRALNHEIQFADAEIQKLEDKILEIMVATDARKEAMKQAEAALRADTAENEKEKEHARAQTAEDEKQLAELNAARKELRSGVAEETLTHYDRVLKLRGSVLAPVHEDESCSACRVRLRPQVFQEVMSNEQIVTCFYCNRILYYVPPPPKAEEEVKAGRSQAAAVGQESMVSGPVASEESLPARIAALRTDGKIPSPFGTEHVRQHLQGEFADTYLNTVLANNCEITGDYVKKGQRAWFRRVSDGLYELL